MGCGASRRYREVKEELEFERGKVARLEREVDELQHDLVKVQDELRRKTAEGDRPGPPPLPANAPLGVVDLGGSAALDAMIGAAPELFPGTDRDGRPRRRSSHASHASGESGDEHYPARQSMRRPRSSHSAHRVSLRGVHASDIPVPHRPSTASSVTSRPSVLGRPRRSVVEPANAVAGYGGGMPPTSPEGHFPAPSADGGFGASQDLVMPGSPPPTAGYGLPQADPTLLSRRRSDARSLAHLGLAAKEREAEAEQRQRSDSNDIDHMDDPVVSSYKIAKRKKMPEEDVKSFLAARPHRESFSGLELRSGDRPSWREFKE
eukprot:TRINITY_DN19297_c0_g1_i1.p1 TRINITY_DN19297_c0_g1~~TRINITY_DN19297_c0_g1_i1.p1  ORF type:complete len:320 (+),score=61.94 TRINITY_DN19297_c0_g1_i1:194-1153(+)